MTSPRGPETRTGRSGAQLLGQPHLVFVESLTPCQAPAHTPVVALSLLGPLGLVTALVATPPVPESEEPAPTWRWKQADKPVKITVIAGSVGAFSGQSFHKRLGGVCENVEIRNLSKTGIGALQMKQRFRGQVLKNRHIKLSDEQFEHWAFVATGLNSIGMPEMTNHYVKGLVELAHGKGMKALVLSPTPWGRDGLSKFKGLEGLSKGEATRIVVDYVMGRNHPKDALGRYAAKRSVDVDTDWDVTELVDIGIDLYNSVLRHEDAELRDVDAMRRLFEKDRDWKKAHADLDPDAYEAALATDAQRAAEVPQWFMRPELRGFDYIHPNSEGHRVIAQVTCPSLPETWGCACDEL